MQTATSIRRRTYGCLAIARRHPWLYSRLTDATAKAIVAEGARRHQERRMCAAR
jgi:hypothetical protein